MRATYSDFPSSETWIFCRISDLARKYVPHTSFCENWQEQSMSIELLMLIFSEVLSNSENALCWFEFISVPSDVPWWFNNKSKNWSYVKLSTRTHCQVLHTTSDVPWWFKKKSKTWFSVKRSTRIQYALQYSTPHQMFNDIQHCIKEFCYLWNVLWHLILHQRGFCSLWKVPWHSTPHKRAQLSMRRSIPIQNHTENFSGLWNIP